MSYRITTIPFSESFFRACKKLNAYEDLIARLRIISRNESFEIEEVIYFFVKSSLDNNHFFHLQEKVAEKAYYEAAFWASKKESKQKTRPTEFKDVDNKNSSRVFTKLLKSTINGLYRKHSMNCEDLTPRSIKSIPFDLELESYLNLLYEISCIKRARNTKTKK